MKKSKMAARLFLELILLLFAVTVFQSENNALTLAEDDGLTVPSSGEGQHVDAVERTEQVDSSTSSRDKHNASSESKKEDTTAAKTDSQGNKEEDEAKRAEKDLEIFRKLFMEKRGQHYQAVRSLMDSYEYEKTYQMIDLLLTRMRTVIGTARNTLIEKGFEPGMPFPSDEETKDAIAVILENGALFGDMALTLPDITHSSLSKKKSEVSNLLKWSITFSQDTGFLDPLHDQLFHLAAQELEIIPKDPDFINPYKQDVETPPPELKEKKKKAKAEKKRGPRVSKVEL